MWSDCSDTCSNGTQYRERVCVEPKYGGQACQGNQSDVMPCWLKHCPGKRWYVRNVCVFVLKVQRYIIIIYF